MSSLKASRRLKRGVATTCSQVLVKSQQMTTIISQFPSSPMVITVATEITTSTVTVCTRSDFFMNYIPMMNNLNFSDEINLIQEEVNNLTEAVEEIDEALEVLQEQIEG